MFLILKLNTPRLNSPPNSFALNFLDNHSCLLSGCDLAVKEPRNAGSFTWQPPPPPSPPCSASAHIMLPTRCGICSRHFSLLISFICVFCSTWDAAGNEKGRISKAAEQLETPLRKNLSWIPKSSQGNGVSGQNCRVLGSWGHAGDPQVLAMLSLCS